jgi:hypothetical protein
MKIDFDWFYMQQEKKIFYYLIQTFFWLIPYARSGPFQSPTPIMAKSMAGNYGISNLSRDGIDFLIFVVVRVWIANQMMYLKRGFTTNSNLIVKILSTKGIVAVPTKIW